MTLAIQAAVSVSRRPQDGADEGPATPVIGPVHITLTQGLPAGEWSRPSSTTGNPSRGS
jgi:hypothetical protein